MVISPQAAPAPTPVAASTPATGPVVAQFNYVIHGAGGMPRMGFIEAQAWPTPAALAGASFEDAVAAAKLVAATPVDDGIHGPKVQQAQGVFQAEDGAFSIAPLGGFHREKMGPLFVDGQFFDAAALSLQVVRTDASLVAVVGRDRVLDLRGNGAAFALSKRGERTPAPSPQG